MKKEKQSGEMRGQPKSDGNGNKRRLVQAEQKGRWDGDRWEKKEA